jgi:hypothetical protein
MSRLISCAIAASLFAYAPAAEALELDTPVELKMSSIRQLDVAKRLDAGDTLTGKALLKVRYYRETAWLLEAEADLAIEQKNGQPDAYQLDMVEQVVKLDRDKQIECHVLLPTTQGKWLGVVVVKKASTVLGSKPTKYRVGCRTTGNVLVKLDSPDYQWPAVGTVAPVNLGYHITIDGGVGAAVAKAKDDVTRTDGKIAVTVELFDGATKQLLGQRTLSLDGKQPSGLASYAFFSTDDGGGEPLQAPEGAPLLYRLTIPTQKGKVVVADGEGTPWRLASNHDGSTLMLEAAFRYEKDAKKQPKPGEWGSPKAAKKKKGKKDR